MKKSNKKVGIIEIFQANHFDYVISVHEYLYKKGFRDINIYVTENVNENLRRGLNLIDNNIEKNDVHIIGDNWLTDYNKIKTHNLDIIYFNSLYYYPMTYKNQLSLFYLILVFLDVKIALTIHNINNSLFYKQKTMKGLFRKILKTIAIKNVDSYVVLKESKKKYLGKFTDKKIEVIPFKIPLKDYFIDGSKKENNKIKVVIPGSIIEKRRNYHQLLKVLDKLLHNKKNNIKFIFLGRIINQEIGKKLLGLKNEYDDNVKLFDDYVPQNKFDRIMINSDYILAPLKKEITLEEKEIYGKTKASGAEFDAYKYKKPLIIPRFYKIMNEDIIKYQYENYNELYYILESLNEKVKK